MSRALTDILNAWDAPRLLVVGDLILDRYLTGAVDRISPEAPIQVLHVESRLERMGGGGSVALNLAVLGARATLLGVVGEDAAAERLGAMAREGGVTLDTVVEAGRCTSVKTRHLARSHTTAQQVLRVDEETTEPIAPATEEALLARLDALLGEADAVLVSDYGKGVVTPGLLGRLVGEGRRIGVPVVVDPKGADFARYRGATALTPNRPETQRATGIAVRDMATAEEASDVLVRDVDLAFALVTLDREGMYLKEAGQPGVHLPTTPREVFDVTGAGDMVVSVLGIALASGASPFEAASLANVAAGLEVERVGAVPVTCEEIAARLAAGGESAAAKCVERPEIAAVAARHRAAGRRVVFTNGCFDVLHAGHVRFLAAAKAHGDALIVGLNSDASVKRIKGASRPYQGQADRAEILAALAAVDHVVVFDSDTPAALIEAVRPDVLVKGMDWKDKGVVGREVVESGGGKVVLVELFADRSTSKVLERLAEDA